MSDHALTEEWVPSGCTLPTAEQPTRLAEFDGLFREALRTMERPDSTRLVLTLESAPGRARTLRDLTGRETECCSFFTFSLTELDSLRLEVNVPPAHVDVLDAIAERAARAAGLAT